jgi:hypothetical protein
VIVPSAGRKRNRNDDAVQSDESLIEPIAGPSTDTEQQRDLVDDSDGEEVSNADEAARLEEIRHHKVSSSLVACAG